MADINPLAAQLMLGRAYNFTPQQQTDIMQAQQQQALSQALLQQGLTPLDQNGRMMGQIASKISAVEGLSKIAQALVGAYGQKNANASLVNALVPQASPGAQEAGNAQDNVSGQAMPQSSQQSMVNDPVINSMPPGVKSQFLQWALPESDGGNPHAAAMLLNSYVKTSQAAPLAYGTGIGGAAASQARPGAYNPVSGQMVQPQGPATPPPQINPISGGPMQPPARAPIPAPQAAELPPVAGAAGPGAANLPLGNIPPIQASSLHPNAAPGIQINAPAPPMMEMEAPRPEDSPTNMDYEAKVAAYKAGLTAQAEAAPAGAKKEAEETGENAAENLQQYIASRSQTQSVLDKLNDMHQANKASSFNALNTAEGSGPLTLYHRVAGDQVSQANTKLEQIRDQGLISQVGPQLAATGSKGNRLLEGIITGADSFKLNTGKPAVATSIDGLGLNYIRNQVAQYDKAISSGAAPPPMAPVLMRTPQGIGYVDPRHVGDAINKGGTFDLSANPLIAPKQQAPQ